MNSWDKSYEDNFDYLPDVINPFPEDKEGEPIVSKHASQDHEDGNLDPDFHAMLEGIINKHFLNEQYENEDDHFLSDKDYSACPKCGKKYKWKDCDRPGHEECFMSKCGCGIIRDCDDNTGEWPEGEDPDDWEKRFRESMRRKPYLGSIVDDEADQLKRGQMGIMDEDSHAGDIGSSILASSIDDDNPGFETDPEHGVSGRDTDDVEEDADDDYGGPKKREKNTSEASINILAALAGIGTIPEGFNDEGEDIHYGDEESPEES